jgi:tetratricopeptide (TPR) repeat protein
VPLTSLTEEYFSSNPIWSLREAARLIWQSCGPFRWDEATKQLAAIANEMLARSIAIPHGPLSDLKSEGFLPADFEVPGSDPTPGVVGIVVDELVGEGFVVPLTVKSSDSWSASPLLPFSKDAVEIQSAMFRLAKSASVSLDGVFPELLEFSLEGGEFLREEAEGRSMIIAGLLAVIRAVADQEPQVESLSCVCSMVQPDESGQLQPVASKSVSLKINAFLREYGRGVGLLVCHPDCSESARFVNDFEGVLKVRCYNELTSYLEPKGLLAPLLKQVNLNRHILIKLNEKLRFLEEDKHDYRSTLDLTERIDSCAIPEDVPQKEKRSHKVHMGACLSHLGRYEDAIQVSEENLESLHKAGNTASHDEIAQATVNSLATHFDGHAFTRIRDKLRPWYQKMIADKRLLTVDTKIRILNTLGRVQVILGEPDWEDNFRQSMELQEESDRSQVPRSRNCLILGLLWQKERSKEAYVEITRNEAVEKIDDFSCWILKFATAEYHRIQGEIWDDEGMESEVELVLTSGNEFSTRPGHPWAFYFQATARQCGRSDVAKRFQLAADLFQKDIGENSENSILIFYSSVMLLAKAAASGDVALWQQIRKRIDDYLSNPQASRIQQYYEESFSAIGESPNCEAVEGLLQQLPLI